MSMACISQDSMAMAAVQTSGCSGHDQLCADVLCRCLMSRSAVKPGMQLASEVPGSNIILSDSLGLQSMQAPVLGTRQLSSRGSGKLRQRRKCCELPVCTLDVRSTTLSITCW